MRRIDRWLGIPLTFLLSGVFHLARFMSPPRLQPPAKRVLFIELSEMGSAILADPAMRKLRDRLDCQLYFVIFAKNRPSLDLLATIASDQAYVIRETNFFLLCIDTLRFFLWTRRNCIEATVDLELFSRFTTLLSALSGARQRVGFYRFHNEGLYRGELLTHRVSYNPQQHIAKNFIALVNALLSERQETPYSKQRVDEAELTLPKLSFTVDELAEVQARIAKRWKGYQPGLHRLALINANASDLLPQRRWMPERYAALTQKILASSADIVALLTGAPSEYEQAEALRAQIGHERCVNFAGALAFAHLPRLYALSLFMVTNDSGPAHFAALTELPTFVLFGPETPLLYRPLSEASRPIFAGLSCSPCVSAANHRKTACVENACLQAITVEEVFALIKPLLTTSPPSHQRDC